ncbi:hypothetical protein ROHU_019734 [Labeo rohita]|uniref:Uncharacterized protein n=1 Tax=Labeo rohita TaxID=84645 RepID=A0A498NDC6_LABRO|nr:hypothetical protein ROHU_019734 [Labeo rohita]
MKIRWKKVSNTGRQNRKNGSAGTGRNHCVADEPLEETTMQELAEETTCGPQYLWRVGRDGDLHKGETLDLGPPGPLEAIRPRISNCDL